jgi:hypothetical protein
MPLDKMTERGGINTDVENKKYPKNTIRTNNATLTPRLTGAVISMNLDYRNHFMASEPHPLVDIEVTAYDGQVGITETEIINVHGGVRKRVYSGVRVRFVRRGSFEYFQLASLFMSITVFIVWIRMPGFLVFYFAVTCLGKLSEIYTRFCYQDLNLNNEFNGVSARLLKRSHGFSDLHDLVLGAERVKAISLATVKKRMFLILQGRKELDEQEREFFCLLLLQKDRITGRRAQRACHLD